MSLIDAVAVGRSGNAPAILTDRGSWTVGDLLRAAETVASGLDRGHPSRGPVAVKVCEPFATAAVVLGSDAAQVPVVHHDVTTPGDPTGAVLTDMSSTGERRGRTIGVADLVLLDPVEPPQSRSDLPARSQTFMTSGSTGKPVGVVRGPDALIADATRVADFLGLREGVPMVAAVPLFHVYGFNYALMAPLLTGVPVRHCSPRSTAAQLVRAVAGHEATILIALPFHYELFGDRPNGLTGLTRAVSAGAPLSARAVRAFTGVAGFTLFNCYGSSEIGAGTLHPVGADASAGAVGVPLPGVSVRVESAGGDVGELMVRTSSLALGKLDENGLAPVAGPDGWYRTRDLARLSADGRIELLGRVDSVINVAGEKVHPAEIERVIAAHPSVDSAHVRADTDETRGQVPVAQVVLRHESTSSELLEWCRDRLAPHQRPRRVEIVDGLPRSATGKVLHRD